jgi:hypothetical protein
MVLTRVLGTLALAALSACRQAEPSLPYDLTPAERSALSGLLAARTGWRVAIAADSTDAGLVDMRRAEPSYEPYFRRGDWNGDGRRDFAVVLARDTAMAAYWFRADGAGFAPAEELAVAGWLRTGGIFEREGALTLAPFASDELFIFRWDSSAHRLRLAPAAEDTDTRQPR